MKRLLPVVSLLLLPAGGLRAADWKLAWSDEFNYQGLPAPAKWDYEEGFVRNHESQYYTRARLENARVENGHLILECRKEHYQPKNHVPVEYTSASLITRQKADWQYVRIEVRAKLPQGSGVWPAIWTLGTNITKAGWPRCGEIDIMEFIGKDPETIHGTIHYFADGGHRSNGGTLKTVRPFDGFHTYAIEWTPERIDFYFDREKYHSVDVGAADQPGGGNPFRAPHYLLLDFALGGWGGPIDDAKLPQQFIVDYVRVYQAISPKEPTATR